MDQFNKKDERRVLVLVSFGVIEYMQNFKPSDDYKIKNNKPESVYLFGFIALTGLFSLMFCYVAQQVVESVCDYNDRAMDPGNLP